MQEEIIVLPSYKIPPHLQKYFRPKLDNCFICNLVQIFREVRRVMRDDGNLWINMGDSYNGSGGEHKHDAGQSGLTKTRDRIGFVKGRNLSDLKPKDLIGVPWMLAFALRTDGWYLRSDIIWSKPSCMPESVTDRPTKAHEYIFLLSKNQKYFYDAEAIREKATCDRLRGSGPMVQPGTGRNDTTQCGDYRIKPVISEDRKDLHGPTYSRHRAAVQGGQSLTEKTSRNKRSVWTVNTQGFPDAHFAVFPQNLIIPCIKAGTSAHGVCSECGSPWKRVIEKGLTAHNGKTETTYKDGMAANRLALLRQAARENGGEYANTNKTIGWEPTCKCNAEIIPATVLDPFVGSGTTCLTAKQLGRNSIGIDKSEKYIQMARRRVNNV